MSVYLFKKEKKKKSTYLDCLTSLLYLPLSQYSHFLAPNCDTKPIGQILQTPYPSKRSSYMYSPAEHSIQIIDPIAVVIEPIEQVISDKTDLLNKAIKHLPAKQQMVIELSYFQEYSIQEIALIANCPVNTVKTRLHHARQKIRAFMDSKNAEVI